MPPSILSPAGPGAAHVERLWWVMFWVLGAVFVLVVAAILYASLRRREAAGAEGVEAEERADYARRLRGVEPRLDVDDRRAVRWVLVSGAAVPFVILVGLFAYTLSTLRALERHDPDPVVIEVTGVDWWWRVRYLDPAVDGSGSPRGAGGPAREPGSGSPGAAGAGADPVLFETANEIRIPVGRTVELRLEAADVIHSFWVPQLAGKLDMIPGRTNVLRLRADRPGTYRGQCAEYCGLQHTNMAIHVVAQPEPEYRAWVEAQRRPAAEPAPGTDAARGKAVFLTTACVACHAIRGTSATSGYGPDLTHVAGRGSLGAGTVPNTPGHMGGWIGDPQSVKPGVHMPPVPLRSEHLRWVTAYLVSLR